MWLWLALLTAFSSATGDAVLKAAFARRGAAAMAVIRTAAPLPILAPALLFMEWPPLPPAFWATLSLLLPLEITALLLYMRAIRTSDLSLTLPHLAFTPSFILLTGWLVLGETVSPLGLAGVVSTTFGAWILHLGPGGRGALGPLKALFREEGSRLMLLVAAIYSLTSVLGKKAILLTDPSFFACFYFVVLGTVTPLVLGKAAAGEIPQPWCLLRRREIQGVLGVGLAQAAMVLSHMWAISLTQASYMIAVKRTSLLFGILYGRIFFREGMLGRRLAGGLLMLLGVALIALAA